MRRLACLGLVLVMVGCVTPVRVTIPDEPKYRDMKVYQVDGGVCFGDEDLVILRGNIKLLKEHADKMRVILEGLRKGE